MTLRDLASDAGASPSYLSRVENGLVAPSSRWVHIVVAAIGERQLAHQKQLAATGLQ